MKINFKEIIAVKHNPDKPCGGCLFEDIKNKLNSNCQTTDAMRMLTNICCDTERIVFQYAKPPENWVKCTRDNTNPQDAVRCFKQPDNRYKIEYFLNNPPEGYSDTIVCSENPGPTCGKSLLDRLEYFQINLNRDK